MATSTNAAYVGVHHITKERAEEHHHGAAVPEGTRWVPIPWTHLRLEATGRAATYEAARAVVRILVKGLWLFPVLLVPKAILWGLDVWYGDLITVAFVVLVVITFGGLSLLSLLHLLAGAKSDRAAAARLRVSLPKRITVPEAAEALHLPAAAIAPPSALAQIAASGATYGPLRLRGTVDAGISFGQPVITERWAEIDGAVVRVVVGSSFALRIEGGPLVAIELLASPVLLGPYGESLGAMLPAGPTSASSVLRAAGPALAAAPVCVIRQGDPIELFAPTQEIVALSALRVDGRAPPFTTGDGGPYRGEQRPAILVRCVAEAPVVIALAAP